MNEQETINVLDLFSGIGGFSLGLERAGPFRTVAFCEREPFCQSVLRKHWPDVPIYDDVRTINADGYRGIDLVCGGFPCQPWSVAGEQRGAEDDRDLWPVMASLIEDIRPRWVIGENVRGFVNEPLGLQRSLSDLESIGYQAVPFVIPACAVDAPHRRDRVWIVAHAPQFQRDGSGEHTEQGERQVPEFGKRGGADDVAHAERIGQQGQGQPVNAERSTAEGNWETVEPEHGGGPKFWKSEPSVGRVANGISNRVDRLKALGNAVVPQVVEQIGKAILAGENR